MKKLLKKGTKAGNLTLAILIGALTACIISLLISILGATLINQGSLAENKYSFVSLLCWVFSTISGCALATVLEKNKKGLVCVLTTAIYLLLLIGTNIIFWGGHFINFWKGILMTASGMLLIIYLTRNKKGNKSKKISYRPK